MSALAFVLLAYMAVFGTNRDSFLKSDFKPSDIPTLTVGAKEKRTHCAGSGSGFFITTNGWLMTNHHVVKDAAEVVVVHNGNAFEAEVVSSNEKKDLALLKINLWPHGTNVSDKVPCLVLRTGDVQIGETVFAIGYPRPELQGFETKVTRGIVNSLSGFKGRSDKFQIDAVVMPGNSGGPLIDGTGCVIGVNSSGIDGSQSCNYAIKMNIVKDFIPDNVKPEWCAVGRYQSTKWVLKNAINASVFILNYQRGACERITRTATDADDVRAREDDTRFRKVMLDARMCKLKKEWKDLKEITDWILDSRGEVGDVREWNDLAREELGLHLIILAEADGRDVMASIKPICGFKEDFVPYGKPVRLFGGRDRRGFPVEAQLDYEDDEWIWRGELKCRYDWRGTKEIRVVMKHIGKK